jgi:hypothetical protein
MDLKKFNQCHSNLRITYLLSTMNVILIILIDQRVIHGPPKIYS